MPNIKRQLTKVSPLSVALVVIFAGAMSYFIFNTFAATGPATLYTSPSGTQSVTNGQSFTVSVRISSDSNVSVSCAAVYLSYPADKLQLTGQSYNGSAYSVEAPVSNSSGIVHMERCALPVVPGGDQLFAQVSFKAIATGSAPLGFTSSSTVLSGEGSSNTNILGQKNGVTYNIAAPATTPPSSGGGSSGGSSGSGGTGSSTPGKPGGGTNGQSSSGSSGNSSSAGGGQANPGNPSTPVPPGGGSNSSSGGSQSAGGSQPYTGATSTIAITVLDSHNKPVEGAEVIVGGQTIRTDKNGIARFSNVPTGDQSISIKYNGKKTSRTIQVKGASTQSPELFKVSVTRNKFNPALLIAPLLVLVVAVVFFFRPWDSRLLAKFAKEPAGQFDVDKIVTSSSNHPSDIVQPTPGTTSTPAPTGHGKLETPGTVYTPTNSNDSSAPSSSADDPNGPNSLKK